MIIDYEEVFKNKVVKTHSAKMDKDDLCMSMTDYANLIFINNKIYQIISINVENGQFVTVEYTDLREDIKEIINRVESEYDRLKRQKDWIRLILILPESHNLSYMEEK